MLKKRKKPSIVLQKPTLFLIFMLMPCALQATHDTAQKGMISQTEVNKDKIIADCASVKVNWKVELTKKLFLFRILDLFNKSDLIAIASVCKDFDTQVKCYSIILKPNFIRQMAHLYNPVEYAYLACIQYPYLFARLLSLDYEKAAEWQKGLIVRLLRVSNTFITTTEHETEVIKKMINLSKNKERLMLTILQTLERLINHYPVDINLVAVIDYWVEEICKDVFTQNERLFIQGLQVSPNIALTHSNKARLVQILTQAKMQPSKKSCRKALFDTLSLTYNSPTCINQVILDYLEFYSDYIIQFCQTLTYKPIYLRKRDLQQNKKDLYTVLIKEGKTRQARRLLTVLGCMKPRIDYDKSFDIDDKLDLLKVLEHRDEPYWTNDRLKEIYGWGIKESNEVYSKKYAPLVSREVLLTEQLKEVSKKYRNFERLICEDVEVDESFALTLKQYMYGEENNYIYKTKNKRIDFLFVLFVMVAANLTSDHLSIKHYATNLRIENSVRKFAKISPVGLWRHLS